MKRSGEKHQDDIHLKNKTLEMNSDPSRSSVMAEMIVETVSQMADFKIMVVVCTKYFVFFL